MATDLNQCNFTGRLGKDPEARTTAGGTLWVTFSIAVGGKKKKQGGGYEDTVEWVRIVSAGKLAEICQQYLKKGTFVRITGQFRTRQWEGQNGQKNYSTEIFAGDMQMLGSVSSPGGQQQGQNQQQRPQQNQQQQKPQQNQQQNQQQSQNNNQGQSGPDEFDDFDDDIPF